jgi:hypothetical protein
MGECPNAALRYGARTRRRGIARQNHREPGSSCENERSDRKRTGRGYVQQVEAFSGRAPQNLSGSEEAGDAWRRRVVLNRHIVRTVVPQRLKRCRMAARDASPQFGEKPYTHDMSVCERQVTRSGKPHDDGVNIRV